jgi:glyoxylase-like metal-dependent hydrolase (beta-lactamase superfamily II)
LELVTIFSVKNIDGITQLQTGPTYWGKYTPFTVSAFLVEGLLIDGGCFKNREQLIQTCGNQVDQVVISHYHLEHCGTGHYFAKQGIPVYAHSDGVPRLEGAQA